MDKKIVERWQQWYHGRCFDEQTKMELSAITDQREIEDRFYCDLEFGTGGIRAVLGAGTNRMNRYIVRKITAALSTVILQESDKGAGRGVVIAYDSRHYSPEFAFETARVLIAHGIRAYLFDHLRPTPELSFAVRHLATAAGVMITASHNPREYNG